MTNTTNRWPKDQEDTLRELHGLGHTFSEITSRINRMFGTNITRSACLGKAVRLGLRRGVSQGSNAPLRTLAEINRKDRRAESIEEKFAAENPQPYALQRVTSDAVLALNPNSCRYPIGDVGHEGFHFCCKPKQVASSYCVDHHKLCTTSTKNWSAWRD